MKIILVGALSRSLTVFRGALIRDLLAAGHEVIAMAGDDRAAGELGRMGARFLAYPVQRTGMNPWRDLVTWRHLRRVFRAEQPDVVLAYTIKPVIWGGLACRAVPGARFVALITGLGFAFEPGGIAKSLLTRLVTGLYRQALGRAEAVVFQNHDNLATFVNRRIVERERTHRVHGSGVDLHHFPVTPLPAGEPVFLCIARLLKDKGLREFAQAAQRVRAAHPSVRFVLVGPPDTSPNRVPLETVRTWADQGWLDYAGPTDDVRTALADCHLYVLPSYHEGMPRTVLEAMATGRPIVTTDAPGCRDTVEDGINGRLVPPGDPVALAEALEWALAHRERWPQMAAESRRRAETLFDVGKVNAAMMTIMELS